MKNKFKLIGIILIISNFLIACDKEESEINIKETKWRIIHVKDIGTTFSQRAKEEYILEFSNDNHYSINLDVNDCWGNYNILNDKEIFISGSGCTEACCDSEFAEDLLELLKKMNKYNIKGDNLFLLSNNQQIKLRKK